MNVFYEEEGTLKVGAVLADNTATLQVEAPHGKRSKIKVAAVLLRFEQPGIADFMAQAQHAAEELDLDFLWECSSEDEFGFDALAREYYGRAPVRRRSRRRAAQAARRADVFLQARHAAATRRRRRRRSKPRLRASSARSSRRCRRRRMSRS